MSGDVHDGHARDLPYPSLQVLITSGDNIDAVRSNSLYNAVIRVSAFMIARESPKSFIPCNSQSNSIFLRQLLELCNDAVSDEDGTWRSKAVKQGSRNIKLVLNREIDEVGIDQDAERWAQRGVVAEKH